MSRRRRRPIYLAVARVLVDVLAIPVILLALIGVAAAFGTCARPALAADGESRAAFEPAGEPFKGDGFTLYPFLARGGRVLCVVTVSTGGMAGRMSSTTCTES